MKKIQREHIWLVMIALGPITAYVSLFYPNLIILAAVFLLIGLRGVLADIM